MPEEAAAGIRVTEFDLARADVSPPGQQRARASRGDINGYLEAFAILGPPPGTDLSES